MRNELQRMNIRRILSTDLEACSNVYAGVFSSAPWNEKWNNDMALKRLTHFFKSEGFFGMLAEDNGVIGLALGNSEPFYSGMIFYLREMCITIKSQRQGVGQKLAKALESELLSQGITYMYLTTERGIPAAQFYEKLDYSYENDMGFYSKKLTS